MKKKQPIDADPSEEAHKTDLPPSRGNPRGLYLSGYETVLDAEDNHFVLRRDGEPPLRLPVCRIARIVSQAAAPFTRKALSLALESSIPVSFVDPVGRVKGHLVPPCRGGVHGRLRQYALFSDPARRLEIAAKIVIAKMESAAVLIRRFSRNHPHLEIKDALNELAALRQKCAAAPDLDALRGFEGAAARAYFPVFPLLTRRRYPFQGRRRQPPDNELNAILSYGYAVLARDMAARLEIAGLDPDLGFLHEPFRDRPSLALDLIEPLRHGVIDALVIKAVNRKELRPEHFERNDDGGQTLLTREGRKVFFRLYDQAIAPQAHVTDPLGNRTVINRECRYFVQFLAGNAPWIPGRSLDTAHPPDDDDEPEPSGYSGNV